MNENGHKVKIIYPIIFACVCLRSFAVPAAQLSGEVSLQTPNSTVVQLFDIKMAGGLYRITLSPPENAPPSLAAADGTKIPWLDIGSDGVDAYAIRSLDTVIVAGVPQMQGKVYEGYEPPDTKQYQLARLLWEIYVRPADESGRKVPQLPRSMFEGGMWDHVYAQFRKTVSAGDAAGIGSTVVSYQSPGYVYLPAGRERGGAVAKDAPVVPGFSAIHLAKPYDSGFVIAEFQMSRFSEVCGGRVPLESALKRNSPSPNGVYATDLSPSATYSIRVKEAHGSDRVLDKAEFLPSLSSGARIHDARIKLPNDRNAIYSANGKKWNSREDLDYKERIKRVEAAQKKTSGRLYAVRAGLLLMIASLGAVMVLYRNKIIPKNETG